jgi:riboflavin synthase
MFTGLIETLCTIESVRRSADAVQLTVDLGRLADETEVGDSIAINGVCLTIAQLTAKTASFDVSPETLRKSALGKLNRGSQVNVERAIKAGDRLGGHIVEGHVDGTAMIIQIDRRGDFANIKFSTGPELLDQMVPKGSVAVDGISLTITDLDKNSFGAAVIPETLKKTTLGKAKVGDYVNVETDIIVKIVKKQLDKILPQKQNLTVEKMKDMGF